MNIIIITGASSGLGREFARQLDQGMRRIDEFWLIARRRDRLEKLAGELRHTTRLFACDLTDAEQMAAFRETLYRERPAIRMLIHSAGYGLIGDFAKIDRDGQLGMIDLNCRALTALTYDCLPFLRRGSRIIPVASSAAFTPEPGFAVYAATKAYALSFSEALGEELRRQEIWVTAVCPGPVDTEFFDLAERYQKGLAMKKKLMVQPERVVRKALRDSAARRSVSVCTLLIGGYRVLGSLLPDALVLRVMRALI